MKLRTLISEYLEGLGEPETKRRRAYVNAVNGLREMAYDVTAAVENVQLFINDADVAQLPDDYVNISRMALLSPEGTLVSIASNDNISLKARYNECGQQLPPNNNSIQQGLNEGSGSVLGAFVGGQYIGSSVYIADHYRNGECTGAFFGLGGGQEGIYRIDQSKRQIQFGARPANCQSVIMEYLADIKSIDYDFEVHPFQVNAVKMWINWQLAIPKGNGAITREAERMYMQAYGLMRRRFNAETAFDWINATRKANAASPRF